MLPLIIYLGGATFFPKSGSSKTNTVFAKATKTAAAPAKPVAKAAVKAPGNSSHPSKPVESRVASSASSHSLGHTAANSGSNHGNEAALKSEIQALKSSNEQLNLAMSELKTDMEGLEKERDFYFDKLRDIEVLLQEVEDSGKGNETTAAVFKILYATAEGFEAANDETEAAAQEATQQEMEVNNEDFESF